MVVFVIAGFFAALGIGVVLVAMRSGQGTAIKRDELSHDSRRATVIAVAVTAAFGVGLPIYILLHNNESRAEGAPGGQQLTADEKEGRELFADKCATCHTLQDAGAVGRVGPSLDTLRPTASLTVDAIVNGRARGQGNMPQELYSGEEAASVARYVRRVAGR